MPDTPEPVPPVEAFVRRAEHIASDAEHHVPSWLRPGDPENRWPVLIAIVAISMGWITVGGNLGSVKVTGTAPSVTANVATVTVGTENKTVTVPTVTINKPGEPAPANSAAPQ